MDPLESGPGWEIPAVSLESTSWDRLRDASSIQLAHSPSKSATDREAKWNQPSNAAESNSAHATPARNSKIPAVSKTSAILFQKVAAASSRVDPDSINAASSSSMPSLMTCVPIATLSSMDPGWGFIDTSANPRPSTMGKGKYTVRHRKRSEQPTTVAVRCRDTTAFEFQSEDPLQGSDNDDDDGSGDHDNGCDYVSDGEEDGVTIVEHGGERRKEKGARGIPKSSPQVRNVLVVYYVHGKVSDERAQ